uniref:G-protein coupled receptors family 1 profile domain-containing protein n=1 Tax=Timema monikensis TaxID=170555 RepID=A0A7R9E6N8_9NEOP|nr:unnamed protein product [Timema monikensis]
MDDEIPDQLLYNCTAELLLATGPLRNVSSAWSLNRSEVLELLTVVVNDEDLFLSSGRSNSFRELLGECLFPQPRPYDLPWWQKLVWAAVFAPMLLVAVGGNAIVMWIVLVIVTAHRRMRTVTNYFLVNLSVADLLISLLNCVFNFIFMINSDWPFGALYCTVNNFISYITVAASAFTLVAISMDRYMAIVRPLHHSLSRSRAIVAILFIWLASCLLATPCLLYSDTMTKRYIGGQMRVVCYMKWPDGTYPTSMTEYMYNVVFLALTYLVPVTVMAVCYSLMGRELWGNRSIGELTQRQLDAIKSKRKVVRMFIMVVCIFALCWLPYHGFFIYAYHNNDVTRTSYVQHMYLTFYWFAMANAMVNPAIYYWMNVRFRLYFKEIICLYCLFKKVKLDTFELPTTKHSRLTSNLLYGVIAQFRNKMVITNKMIKKVTYR